MSVKPVQTMAEVVLQFQGTDNQLLLAGLVILIVGVLVAAGSMEFYRRRWRSGLLCLAGVLGPVGLLIFLLCQAAIAGLARRTRAMVLSLAAAGATISAIAGGAAFVIACNWSASALWLTVLGLQAIAAVIILYSSVYRHLGLARMAALTALRCLAVVALLLILFKPAFTITAGPRGAAPSLPILVDCSGSMATADRGGVPRHQLAFEMLSSQRQKLAENFRLSLHRFAGTSQTVGAIDDLSPAKGFHTCDPNEGTDIAVAIIAAAADLTGDKSSAGGVVLVSDGIHNASGDVLDAVKGLGVPVYVAAVGAANLQEIRGPVNLEILGVTAPLEVIANNTATITAQIKATSIDPSGTKVSLMAQGQDIPLDVQTLGPSLQDNPVQNVQFKYTPTEGPATQPASGDSRLKKLRVSVARQPLETLTEDNDAPLHVLVSHPQIRVLCIEGTIRPEYKYLHRFLQTDLNMQYMGLVRVSGDKFWAQGEIAGRKLQGLPASKEDMDLFDVVIIGDLDSTFLGDRQMGLFREFVNGGGGLLMLGGHNSFGPGGYGGSELESVLPVATGTREQPQEMTLFVPRLTAQGQGHPIFEGIAGFYGGPDGQGPSKELPAIPPLDGCVTVAAAKGGASVLAIHPSARNAAGPLTVLAVQSYGAGRSAAFTADTTWKWYLPMRTLGEQSPYNRFWGQLIRWLANTQTKGSPDAPAVVMRLDRPNSRLGQAVNVMALVQGEKGQPAQASKVTCRITQLDAKGNEQSQPMAASDQPGQFQGQFTPAHAGKYRLHVTAASPTGQALGEDDLTLLVLPPLGEMDRLGRNDDLLKEIANRSGGSYEDITRLGELIDQIIARKGDSSQASSAPAAQVHRVYNFPTLLAGFVCLLTAEWVLRRRWQLS